VVWSFLTMRRKVNIIICMYEEVLRSSSGLALKLPTTSIIIIYVVIMKLNQATNAAAFLATATLAEAASHGELKDQIAPLLASRPNRHLLRNRMLQSSDTCIADYDAPHPTYDKAIDYCISGSLGGDLDYSDCDLSLLAEACATDNRKFKWTASNHTIILYPPDLICLQMFSPFTSPERYLGTLVTDKWGDVGVACTVDGKSHHSFILKESNWGGHPWCVATSCVSEQESLEGAVSFEFQKDLKRLVLLVAPGAEDVECKNSNSAGEDTVGATEEGSSVGSSADEEGGDSLIEVEQLGEELEEVEEEEVVAKWEQLGMGRALEEVKQEEMAMSAQLRSADYFCGCPSCTQAVISQIAESYSCEARMNWMMETAGMS